MKKTGYYSIAACIAISLAVIGFVPFTNHSSNKEGEQMYCRYRLNVYTCRYIESEGEGNHSTESDTFFGNLILEKKIGGPMEYFGLRRIVK